MNDRANIQREKEALLSQWICDHSPMVLRIAFTYVKDQMTAEDIAQEVFLRAYQHMESYREDASVSTWLYRITVNVCKNYIRSWKYRKLVLMQKVPSAKDSVSSLSAEQEAMQQMDDDRLWHRVLDLPLKYREVIVMYYFENLKSREIADLLQQKESTVRVRIARGIAKLKAGLDGGVQAWMI